MNDTPPDIDRDELGVRIRRDGRGDAWAMGHRSLGPTYNMHDIDALFGCHIFGANTGERLFLEYVPDDYKNREKTLREFAAVAMFDRKTTETAAFSDDNILSIAFYHWQCRCYAKQQPIPPRFFLVIGGQIPPWTMIELDIFTDGCNRIGNPVTVDGQRFKEVWDAIGLSSLRTELRSFINPRRLERRT